MPYGSPASLVMPGRGAGTGAAVIFRGNNLGTLNIYAQAQRLREARLAREAARKAKEDAERFKQMQTGVKLDDDTAPYYQGAYSDLVAGAKQQVGARYNEKTPLYIGDPFSRQAAVDSDLAPVRTYKRLADDDWNGYVKPTIATAKGDAELQGDEIEKALYNAHYTDGDATKGTLIAPQDLPRGYHEKILNDPRFINQANATDNYFKKIPASQEYAEAIKGKPGTYATTDDLMTRLVAIEPDGKGGHQVKLDAQGRPVLRNPLTLLQATEGTKFGRLLDEDVRKQASLRESAVAKMQNMEPLTPEERAAATGPLKSKLDFLTERALGHVQIKSRETSSYIPYPRPRAAAGGGTGFVAPTGQLVPGDYQANLPVPDVQANVATGYTSPIGGAGIGTGGLSGMVPSAPIVGFAHLGQTEQPMRADKYGNSKAEVRARGTRFTQYYEDNGKGEFTEVSNNRVPQDGVYGKAIAHAVDVKTNKPLFGKTEAEIKEAIRNGSAKPQLFVEYETDKNTNFNDEYEGKLQQMIENNENAAYPKSVPELEDAAKKFASRGVRRQLIPFDQQNAQLIDAATNGHYRAAQRNMLAQARKLRAATPAATPKRSTGVSGLGASSTTKSAGTKSTGVKW